MEGVKRQIMKPKFYLFPNIWFLKQQYILLGLRNPKFALETRTDSLLGSEIILFLSLSSKVINTNKLYILKIASDFFLSEIVSGKTERRINCIAIPTVTAQVLLTSIKK